MNSRLRGSALVAEWRNSAGLDNPAGPLFTGEFAEADILGETGCGPTACCHRTDSCTLSDTCHTPCQ